MKLKNSDHVLEPPAKEPGATLRGFKETLKSHFDSLADNREAWIRRNHFFHEEDLRFLKSIIPPGLQVLEVGCGTGHLLALLEPEQGVGIDISPKMVDIARENHPHLDFRCLDIEQMEATEEIPNSFDVIVLSDLVGLLHDVEAFLHALQNLCGPETRIVVSHYSKLWELPLRLVETLGLRMPQVPQSWLSERDIVQILDLADFDVVRRERRQLLPFRALFLGPLLNRVLGALPVFNLLALRTYVVARSMRHARTSVQSVSVVIPCRNEKGNIESAIQRMPVLPCPVEVIYVEGNSSDKTLEECHRVQQAYPDHDIKVLVQDGKGKYDAVKKGFAHASGELLVILDADLTVPPETLPRFIATITSGKAEFVNGTRFVYPMEKDAMRFLNYWANRTFALLFSWLLGQSFTDTLCGTKVMLRHHYERLIQGGHDIRKVDPFGDFDLIFGASRLSLRIREQPVRYLDRQYGSTQILRFRDGLLLLRLVFLAFRRFKMS